MERETKIFAIIATITLVVIAFTSCLALYHQMGKNDITDELDELDRYGGYIYVDHYTTNGQSYVYVPAGGISKYYSHGVEVKGMVYNDRSQLTTYVPYDSIIMIRVNLERI